MKIENAIRTFGSSHLRFVEADHGKCLEVVKELGLPEANFEIGAGVIFDTEMVECSVITLEQNQYVLYEECETFQRRAETIRIYPTMILAKYKFNGSTIKTGNTYAHHPHFYALSNFLGDSSLKYPIIKAQTVLCPSTFLVTPIGFECVCGQVHSP